MLDVGHLGDRSNMAKGWPLRPLLNLKICFPIIFCLFLIITNTVKANRLETVFYPFGTENGDTNLTYGDDTFEKVTLKHGFRFFGTNHSLVKVSVKTCHLIPVWA